MKKFLFVFLVFLSSASRSQSSTNQSNPQNKTQQSNSKKLSNNHTQNLVSSVQHDNCVKKEFSIVFYVVLSPTVGVGIATPANIATMVNNLNAQFGRICIAFKNCSTVLIPNYNYNRWRYSTTEPIVTSQFYSEKTINFYIVDSVSQNLPEEDKGYSYGPSPTATADKKELIVMEKFLLLAGSSAAVVHQMGHFFGLTNTHGEISPVPPASPAPPTGIISQEWADGTNCTIHGDGICDTEADTGPQWPTTYNDGKGDFYIKPFDNFMSHYSNRCRFTQQQYNKMADIALTTRFYLH